MDGVIATLDGGQRRRHKRDGESRESRSKLSSRSSSGKCGAYPSHWFETLSAVGSPSLDSTLFLVIMPATCF
ncbi:hypothetical protein VNO77_35514 [Canavalia gladiata]|uniref:Uncharacterized protein n=1 Tax=Canavalia gladiata TaxID=3824 RepID=A0AAN9PXS5_CANGL